MVLMALGELSLARADYPRALDHFRQADAQAQHLSQIDTSLEAQIGIANALLKLGQIVESEKSANAALTVARSQGAIAHEVNALRLLARIDSACGNHASATAHFEAALETARRIDGYLIPSELKFALAEEYARAERHADAYRMAILASAARERVLNREASNRATALQVRMETERSRAESERHQRLAEAEAKRAELLQQSSDTLALLGAIGQEITSQLDKEHVFSTIEHHVHGLLDASSFAIYLMDADGLGMTSVYDIEEGVRLPGDHVRIDDPLAYSALCVRERRELLLDFTNPLLPANYVPGSLETVSGLFAPLTIADRILGVMTIQSTKPHVYADNERLIFRTLCAYAAIALDNAVAYSHLRDAKDQLVVQEKLAALGSLVAGVAHELNTPIGNSLLTASTLQQNTTALEAAAASGTMRRSTLRDYIASTQEGLTLVIRGLQSAGDLVQSFKQVAVDRATEQRRTFELLRTSQEVIATLQRTVHNAGHRLLVDVPADITLDGYPGPYGQVLTNLINNALLHAFGSRTGGTMELRAHMLRNGQVEVRFSDDGVGIAAENLTRIFDPFFTTKMGQGGSGLGMSISYNIVTSLFGGEFEVDSSPGKGSSFVMRLPLEAPQHAAADPLIHSRH
jgi:signal transduction histidine kinase